MHPFSVLLKLLFASAAAATPHGAVFGRANCGKPAQSVLSCIQSAPSTAASSFCASYIATKTTIATFQNPTTKTTTVTSTTGTSMVTATNTVTATSTATVTMAVINTVTDSTVYSSTISSTTTVATSTSTESATTTVLTCGTVTPTPPAKRAAVRKVAAVDVMTQMKRQDAANPSTCASGVSSNVVSNACNNCAGGYPTVTSSGSTTVTRTRTNTAIVQTNAVVTVTPTSTATTTATVLSTTTQHVVLTTDTTTIISTTATTTTTTTHTTNVPSPTPTAFNLYYVPTAGSNTATQYAVQSAAPGGSGTMVAFTPNSGLGASAYKLDANNALADFSGNELATNAVDEYGYLYSLVPGQTSATCSACNGVITCTSGNQGGGSQFAVCDGFLALGTTFGLDGAGRQACTLVTLQFVGVAQAT